MPVSARPRTAPEESLATKTASSVAWMTVAKWVSRIGGLATTIMLTRTLAAEDFGIAAAATTLLPLIYVLSDIGFATYLVQAERIDKRTLGTAFWFTISSALVLSAFLYFAAPLVAWGLRIPEVAPLLRVMTSSVLLVALGSVPQALLRRKMAFRQLAAIDVAGTLVAQAAAIIAAVLGAGAWALIIQVIVSQVVGAAAMWAASRWVPSFQFSRERFKVMAGFGLHLVGSNLALVVRGWAETAIVVAGLGVREMGLLNIGQRLVQTTQDLTVAALLPVSTVAFSRVRDDVDRLRSSYLRGASISYAAIAPLMIFVAVSAPTLAPFLFGHDKASSAAAIPTLAVVFALSVGWAVDQGLLVGTGRPARWFGFISVSYFVTLVGDVIAVRLGLASLLTWWIVMALVEAIVRSFLVAPVIRSSPWAVAMPVIAAIPPAGVAVGAGLGAMFLTHGMPALLQLFLTGVAVLVLYLLALRLLRPNTTRQLAALVPERFARPLRRVLPSVFGPGRTAAAAAPVAGS